VLTLSDPRWLDALLAVPVLALLELLAARRVRRAVARLVGTRADSALRAQCLPGDRTLGATLRLAAATLLILGAAGPEWGREVVRRTTTGSDVVLAMDVSASMDARDVPPSRLDEARREALAVVDRLAGSRVGVVAFAGDAVRLCPLTLDRAAVRLVVEGLSSGTVSEPGTDIGRALSMSLKVLPPGRRDEQAIVLWTDGEDLERGARDALQAVAAAGVRVFTVGVGTPAGDVVPVLDADGRTVDVKRDANGGVVRSKLDEGLLREIARRTRGAYFRASRPGGELPRLLSTLDNLARAGRIQRLVERPVARFPWFAAAAALLLAWDRVRRHRADPREQSAGASDARADAAEGRKPRRPRTPRASGPGLGRAAALVLAMVGPSLVGLLVPGVAQAVTDWARGDKSFKAGRYAAAESLYARRLAQGAPDAVRLNRATARALAGHGPEAQAELEPLSGKSGAIGREAGYNLGTLLGQRRELEPALKALRRVLEDHPEDQDARFNYEVLLRQRERQKRPRPQQPNPTPQQPQPQSSGPQGQQPQPQGSPPPSPSPGDRPPPSPTAGGMSRQQADQILNALQELSRAEQQRRRAMRPTTPRGGRDW
jgi:Ca-activated chloride channel homolog